MMIRGFKTISSRAALAAMAGMLMGAHASAPAYAADLGGGCCADLEERVAELEATTARKGNRVVSLQVYGQVNKALLIWDDGRDSDAFIVDNDFSGSRVGFIGKAAMKPGWTAGYLIEFDYQDAASDKVNNVTKNGDDVNSSVNPYVNNGEIVIRQNNLWIESERLGRVTLGQGSTAGDGATEVVLGNSLSSSLVAVGSGFRVRTSSGGFGTANKTLSSSFHTGDSYSGNLDAPRDQVIRYDSPAIYGFIASASWGDNDYADVALRFKREWNSVRVAAAIAYQWDNSQDARVEQPVTDPTSTTSNAYNPDDYRNEKFESLGGSISIMHVPTGFYGAFAAGEREYDDGRADASFWYVQLGLEKKFLPYGSTTVYGEYGIYSDFAVGSNSITESEAERWGFGVVQKFDSAAIELYAQANFWSFENTIGTATHDDLEDLSTVMLGSRIKF